MAFSPQSKYLRTSEDIINKLNIQDTHMAVIHISLQTLNVIFIFRNVNGDATTPTCNTKDLHGIILRHSRQNLVKSFFHLNNDRSYDRKYSLGLSIAFLRFNAPSASSPVPRTCGKYFEKHTKID